MSDPFAEGAAAARVRRLRSYAIAAALIIFVALVFAISVAKLSANVHHG